MLLVASETQVGMDAISKKLEQLGEAVTLENWLRLAYPGEGKKLSDVSPEEIDDIPPSLIKMHKVKNAVRNTKKAQ